MRDQWLIGFPEPPVEAGVMVRWWWFGPDVDEAGIDEQLRAMRAAGITGVELAFVYPLGPGSGEFLSPEFLAAVGFAARRATDLGMRFDLTLGSGWSYGGAHVPAEHASQCLRWEERSIQLAAAEIPLAGRWPGDKLVAAFIRDGALEDHHDGYTALPIVDDVVRVPPGLGPRALLVATSGPTGQLVKRAAVGAEGYVLDHYSRAATEHHLAAVGQPLYDAAGGADHIRAVFSDSMETYLADWTPGFVEEFRARRGYDPRPELFRLHTASPAGDTFRADYHRTLSELYEDNFLAVVGAWAEARAVAFRVQNYGHPPARVSGYRHAHMIEGEGWDWLGIPQTKWAASAAHHLGVDVVSSETWTWNNSPSFRSGPLDYKGEAHEHMLSGINQLIGHGWPYSPADAVEPGWAFYASSAITNRNAWWDAAAPSLLIYLGRCSWALRQGEPIADVGLWLPYDDTYADFRSGEELNLWRRSAARIGRETTAAIRRAGYDFDVIDGETPDASIRRRHRVIVVSHVNLLTESDRAKLKGLAAAGIGLVFVDSGAAEHFPGAVATTAGGLAGAIGEVVAPDARIVGGEDEVGVVHRRMEDEELYFVVNTGAATRDFTLEPRAAFNAWEILDPRSGTSRAGVGDRIALTLAPYQAVFVVTSPAESGFRHAGTAVPGEGHFVDLPEWSFDGPGGVRRVGVPHVWESDGLGSFAGSASYTTVVEWTGPGELVLDPAGLTVDFPPPTQPQSYQARTPLPVSLVAEVFVNGHLAGVLWDPPFALEISDHLREGRNTIRLRVSSTSVPAMRNPEWEQIFVDAHTHYGSRFAMQDLDQIPLITRSGLLAVPRLRRPPARGSVE